MDWLPEPYAFVRAVTLVLAAFWALRGARRGLLGLRRLGDHFEGLGIGRHVVHRAAVVVALRATVLDPINLALILSLGGIWYGAASLA